MHQLYRSPLQTDAQLINKSTGALTFPPSIPTDTAVIHGPRMADGALDSTCAGIPWSHGVPSKVQADPS